MAISIREMKKAEEGVNFIVEKSGLVISEQFKFLGGSPDGIVFENGQKSGLIEVKNVLHNKPIGLNEAAEKNKNFCLELQKCSRKLSLKTNHNYYMQCQGLLQICDSPWIDFVVRSVNPYQLHIEHICRNDSSWKLWFPKLKAFYYKTLLPELACPRKGKSLGIYEPGLWFEDKSKKVCPVKKAKTTCNRSSTDTHREQPDHSAYQCSSSSQHNTRRASTRQLKFVGERITHKWKVSEDSDQTEWYNGIVLSLVSGTDGCRSAVYNVLYDGEDEIYEIDHLLVDYEDSSLKLIHK